MICFAQTHITDGYYVNIDVEVDEDCQQGLRFLFISG